MAKARKSATRTMNETEQKIAGMKSIEATLDLTGGVSVAAGEALLADARAALEDYNQTLALADEKLNVFNAKERVLRGFNKKVLPAVGLKYGTDSAEYEMVGGTRDSERAKPKPKHEPAPTP
ncbi:MAG: hypothetical protein M3384_21975 [Acidobacteriota bacterium]|nr:hypothetical protein [Acidobacteriota bacterium]